LIDNDSSDSSNKPYELANFCPFFFDRNKVKSFVYSTQLLTEFGVLGKMVIVLKGKDGRDLESSREEVIAKARHVEPKELAVLT
jgi:hypothetical protein